MVSQYTEAGLSGLSYSSPPISLLPVEIDPLFLTDDAKVY